MVKLGRLNFEVNENPSDLVCADLPYISCVEKYHLLCLKYLVLSDRPRSISQRERMMIDLLRNLLNLTDWDIREYFFSYPCIQSNTMSLKGAAATEIENEYLLENQTQKRFLFDIFPISSWAEWKYKLFTRWLQSQLKICFFALQHVSKMDNWNRSAVPEHISCRKNRKDKKLSKIFWQTAVELHGKEKNTPAHCCQCQPSAFSDLYSWIRGESTSMSAGPTLTRCLKKSSSYGQNQVKFKQKWKTWFICWLLTKASKLG